MEYVQVPGGRLAYRQQGEGPAAVLLHPGFVADGMLPLLSEPALAGYQLVAYHRRGYGSSERAVGPVSIELQARDVVEVLDHLGIAHAYMVGHSFGADIALQVALTAPDHVGGLVLMDPLLGFLLSAEAAAFVAETAERAIPQFMAGQHAEAVDTWLNGAFGPGYRETLERTLPGAWQTTVADAPTAFGVELPALQEWALGPDDLPAVRPPTLSLVNNDERWPGFRQTHEALLATIPNCEGAAVDVPSHLLQIAEPRPVAEAISSFLARHPLDR